MQPFKIDIPQQRLDRILGRVADFDWEGFPDAGGWSAGIGKDDLRRIMDHWTGAYDWRAQERALNAFPHFTAPVDGCDLHFIHLRSGAPTGRPPILLMHGWPGSFAEFIEVAPRLASPERFGGASGEGFDLVIPSLPGYGLSGRPPRPIGARTVAAMMHRLMTGVLGYDRYIAQGGDWGSTIAGWMAHDFPDSCAGLHLNMAILERAGVPVETDEEREFRKAQLAYREQDGGYAHIQRTRPQTLGFALQDSPVGTAAWILDKFAAWSDIPRPDGRPQLEAVYALDHLLTNIMLYVATGTITTSAWFYLGHALEKGFPLERAVTVPTGMAVFPDPVFRPPPRSLAEKTYNIVRWTPMARGGHFAAMEQPELFADDLRAFALSIVNGH